MENRQLPLTSIPLYSASLGGHSDQAIFCVNSNIDQTISCRLARPSEQNGCENHELIYSATVCYLSQLTSQTDFTVAVSLPQGDPKNDGDVAGPFSAVLPIRNLVDSTASFIFNLTQLTNSLRSADHNTSFCIASVGESQNHHDGTLVWIKFMTGSRPISTLDALPLNIQTKQTLRLISIDFGFAQDGTIAWASCCSNFLEDDYAKSFIGGLVAFMDSLFTSPELSLTAHELISTDERREIFLDWNNAKSNYQKCCVHELFERQVERTPYKIAIEFHRKTLTYAQLNCRSNRIAHCILSTRPPSKIKPRNDFLVGICVERSLEMAIGMLGAMKAGYAYVPIDPSYPVERISFLMQDAGIKILLTQRHLIKTFGNLEQNVICLEEESTAAAEGIDNHTHENIPVERVGLSCDDPIAVLYTSGSTGRPKGVFISHRGLVSRLQWMNSALPFTADEVAGHIAQLPFVRALWELFVPLTAGIKVVIVDLDTTKDPEKLSQCIGEHNISRLVTAPSLAQTLISSRHQPEWGLRKLKRWFIGGESLHYKVAAAIKEALPTVSIVNLYGATEVHSFATHYPVTDLAGESARVPIGRAIDNTAIAILDQHRRILPMGIQGEICVLGDGVANGYLQRPELTVEKFTAHSFTEVWNSPLYRTGDVGYRLSDGNTMFVSRTDHQVKIRGIRVELGEVETALLAHEEVEKAVVVSSEFHPDDFRLTAYIVARPSQEKLEARQWQRRYIYRLRRFLEQKLPHYMIPSYFSILEKLPLNAYGKILRKELPAPGNDSIGSMGYSPPGNEREKLLCGIWEDVLGIDQIGMLDNFFDLGGHSLLAARIKARVDDAFSIELPLRDVFERPSVAELAQAIDELVGRGLGRLSLARADDCSPAPLPEEIRPWKRLIDNPKTVAHFCARFFGEVDLRALRNSLAYLVERHDALRMVFKSTDDGMRMIPSSAVHLDFSVIDMRDELSRPETSERFERERLRETIRGVFASPPDLASGCRTKWVLIQIRPLQSVFFGMVDHMVVDASSVAILKRELGVAYEAYFKGCEPNLPPLAFRYFDYAHWQERYRATASYTAEKLAHKDHLQSVCSSTARIQTLPAGDSKRYYHGFFRIDGQTQIDISDFCAGAGITENMLYTAAFHLTVYMSFEQEDILLVASAADRRFPELQDAVGLFMCHRYVRSVLAKHTKLADFIAQTKKNVLASYSAGFTHLEQSEMECELPVSDFHVTYRNFPGDGQWNLYNLEVKPVEFIERLESADLHMVNEKNRLMMRVERDETTEINILGSGLIFSEASFQRFSKQFTLALRALARASNSSITIEDLLRSDELLQNHS